MTHTIKKIAISGKKPRGKLLAEISLNNRKSAFSCLWILQIFSSREIKYKPRREKNIEPETEKQPTENSSSLGEKRRKFRINSQKQFASRASSYIVSTRKRFLKKNVIGKVASRRGKSSLNPRFRIDQIGRLSWHDTHFFSLQQTWKSFFGMSEPRYLSRAASKVCRCFRENNNKNELHSLTVYIFPQYARSRECSK